MCESQNDKKDTSISLHATNETLLPYRIVIAAETMANAEAVRRLRRDCAVAHPLFHHRTIITWEKGRSRRPQRRSFDHRAPWSVPKLIEQVHLMTEPLLPYAAPDQRQYLFLARMTANQAKGSGVRVGLASEEVICESFQAFCRRHDLRDRHGQPLVINLAMLRPTGLALAHRALGGDILATQRLANHRSARTTVSYLQGPETAAENDRQIAQLQAQWVEAISAGKMTVRALQRQLGVDEVNAEAILAGRHATASGFICKDPFAGVAPGQSQGQLCTLWLECLVCPQAVIPMEPKYLARLLQVRDHLVAARDRMSPDRWRLLYAPKVVIIERDILPRFTDQAILTEARESDTTGSAGGLMSSAASKAAN